MDKRSSYAGKQVRVPNDLRVVEPGDGEYRNAVSPAWFVIAFTGRHHSEAFPRYSTAKRERIIFAAIKHAIESGMRFEPADFKRYSLANHGDPEIFYRLACEAGNIPACISIEELLGRKPFFWWSSRVYVGREFEWGGELKVVTSFSEDGNMVRAVSAASREIHRPGEPRAPQNRAVISRVKLQDFEKARLAKLRE